MSDEGMDGDRGAKAREIFAEAAAMSADARSAYLRSACGGDWDLCNHVTSLLSAHDRAGDFIAGTTIGPDRLAEIVAGAPEAPGDSVGRYKLLQLIGEGGFGSVYLAEQQAPVRRKVAVKVIKLGMDTKHVVARFEAERQALAMMDHPSIAKVLDAGATESGKPYFVMELVRGVPITEYCDANAMSTKERLELFVPVCQAVQHAHQKGVVHRDLKPGNVLVTLHDGRPVPKVIDFGIAKAVEHPLTERTLFTEHRQMLGTPQYMSPEQAAISAVDVDTRSDVYGLGVLLYELLTGTTPFDAKELRRKAVGEIQRILREVEPPAPSTRISTLGATLAAVAAQRRTEPQKLSRLVRGELDWVVMKCLEKDRARRYETASALADDLQRYLRDELVQARPSGLAHRLRKTARRHRVALATGAVVATSLLLGLCAATVGLVHATAQRDAAVRARAAEAEHRAAAEAAGAKAEHARAQAVAVNALLHDVFVSVNRRRTGDETSLRRALDGAAAEVERGTLRNQPDLEAAVRSTLGNLYFSWGFHREADRQMRAALDIRRRTSPPGGSVELANSLSDLAWLLHAMRKLDEAEPLLRESVRLRKALLGERHPGVADALHALAMVTLAKGDRGRGHALVSESLAIRLAEHDAALDGAPNDPRLLSLRAHVRARSGDFAGALADYGAAVDADPGEHWNWYLLAVFRLHQGDRERYLAACRGTLERLGGDSRPEVAERAVKARLLDPELPEGEAAALAPRLERALASNAPAYEAWFQITKGILDYRLGRYDSAISWLTKGRAGLKPPAGRALADFFLAMSFHHVGRADLAEKALANGIRLTPDDPLDVAALDPLDGGSAITNWAIAHIARREAEKLVRPPGGKDK